MSIRFMSEREAACKLPLEVYTVGFQEQEHIVRTGGFSAHQLFVTEHGKGVLRVPDLGLWEIGTGDVFFVREGVVHEYHPMGDEAWKIGFVSFTGKLSADMIDELELGNVQVIRKKNENGRIEELVKEIWLQSDQQNDKTVWQASQSLYALLMEVHFASRGDIERPQEPPGVMNRLVSFLQEHYSLPVQIPDIAKSIGYTPQHLNRLFRKEFGIPVQKYLQQIRLQKAAELLQHSCEFSVHEVAARVGMETGYFIKSFKRAYGITPGQMKRPQT